MIIKKFLVLVHITTVFLLLGTLLNARVPPSVFPGLNLLSLAFPGLMVFNLLLCLVWTVLRKKRALLFLAVTLLFLSPARRWVNYSALNTDTPNLKIVSVNVKGLAKGKDKVDEYLKNTDADLILSQESIGPYAIPGYAHQTKDYSVVALNSKTEIIREGNLSSDGVGNAFFADIKCNGKIIRVINVYLTPFSFDKGKVKPADDFDTNKTKVKYILKRLIPVFRIHEAEVLSIRTAVEHSPYPVILAGDFNAVPNSYEYYTLLDGLQDAFVEAGTGSATSFHDYKIPIRIDYVFASKTIKAIRYTVDRSVKISDHYPVIAEFKVE
jgi:endonuclease/exonuclease/phosphatase (EEP) superfamily protein YafD